MISVIIPVHNTKKYISKCLESVLNQIYSDLEIICIDSSTDGTTQIIKEYVNIDNRVRHIIDPNGSYGYKLNVGFQIAEGEYVAIVDSDDYIMPEMLEVLLEEVVINHLDFVKSDFESFYIEDGEEKITEYKENMWDAVYYGEILDFKQNVTLLNQISVSIWTGLYRRDFITKNHIQLHESPAASFQDTGFSVFSHVFADRVKYIHRSFYKYRTDNSDSSVKSQKKYKAIADEWRWIETQLKEYGTNELILRQIRLKKYASYYWNFYRLDPNAAKLFSCYIYEEIKKECFEEETIKFCPLFLKNQIKAYSLSDDVFQKCASDIERINQILCKQDIVLFSAGRIGQRVLEYDRLTEHNAISKICDNYVTQIIADGKEYPVCKIEEIVDLENRDIIIANKRSALEMKKQLLSLGAKEENIYVIETFLNYEECPAIKVSIIVPVYNAGKYIETCIRSLLTQSEKSFEIILVDDGSQDNSYNICKEYEEKDSRIRVIHQDNAGVTEARRLGLTYAKGKYVCFVDADDWVDTDYIQSMLLDAEIYDAEVVIGNVYLNDEKSGTERKECNRVGEGLYTEERKMSDLYPYMMWYPCQWEYVFGVLQYIPAKLYKRGIIENALEQLDSSIYDGEDVVCTYSLLLDAKKIFIGKYCDYHYRIHSDSECQVKKEWRYFENAQKIYKALTYRFNGDRLLGRQLHHFMSRYINNGSMDIFGYQYYADYMYKNWRLPDGTSLENKKICIYGAGQVGKSCYKEIIDVKNIEIVAWFDSYSYGRKYGGMKIEPRTELGKYSFDYIIIAVADIESFNEIRNFCISLGIDEKKIIGTYELKYHLLVAEDLA